MTGCSHADFHAEVDVNRLEDIAAFTADVRIRCLACGEPFTFIGIEPGLSSDGPRVSIDGLECHLPIRPESDHDAPIHHFGFDVRPVGPRKPLS